MTGENGAKLHMMIRNLRDEANDLTCRASVIEDAWSRNDLKALVRLGALTAADAAREDAAYANTCDGCGGQMNPMKLGFVNLKTGEKYHDRCTPEGYR